MAKINYFKTRGMSVSQQVVVMKQHYPHFRCIWKNNTATWIGTIQPTAASEEYLVRIQYQYGSVPKVWVIRPPLKRRISGERIPHVYPGNRLCLFLPGTQEWTYDKAIAQTIVPWTSLWLYYYEVWHATGEWLGGGVHPAPELKTKEMK